MERALGIDYFNIEFYGGEIRELNRAEYVELIQEILLTGARNPAPRGKLLCKSSFNLSGQDDSTLRAWLRELRP